MLIRALMTLPQHDEVHHGEPQRPHMFACVFCSVWSRHFTESAEQKKVNRR